MNVMPQSMARSILDRVMRPRQATRNAGVAADKLSSAVRQRKRIDREVSDNTLDGDRTLDR
jgi:hypothetical protein